MHRFANPNRFMKLATTLTPWAAWSTVVLLGAGLYFALFASPADYQQGETVRMMYVHVAGGLDGHVLLRRRRRGERRRFDLETPLADLAAKATSPVGAAFTF